MDEFPIGGGYVITFPCFGIESGTSGLLARLQAKGMAEGMGFVLNTDEDLAERYRQKHDLQGRPIPFPTLKKLLLHLMSLPADVTHVLADPHGCHVVVVGIGVLCQRLLRLV